MSQLNPTRNPTQSTTCLTRNPIDPFKNDPFWPTTRLTWHKPDPTWPVRYAMSSFQLVWYLYFFTNIGPKQCIVSYKTWIWNRQFSYNSEIKYWGSYDDK